MTEQEWLVCKEPDRLLAALWAGGRQSERKLRLFGVACVRRIWPLLSARASRQFRMAAKEWADVHRIEGDVYQASRECVEVLERRADGLASDQQVLDAYYKATAVALLAHDYIKPQEPHEWAATAAAALAQRDVERLEHSDDHDPPIEYYNVPLNVALAVEAASGPLFTGGKGAPEEFAAQVSLVRDIFGNPYRTVAVARSWQTATVLSLATAIYDERGFDRLPILADALEDAGCDSADILNHCRQPGAHVRGCWVLDLLLAQE